MRQLYTKLKTIAVAILLFLPCITQAQTIFLFSFENTEAVTTGSGTFTSGTALGNAGYFGGRVGQSRSFDSWNTNDFYKFQTSTVGYSSLTFSFYDRTSNANINQFQLRYSTDDATWINVGATFTLTLSAFQTLGSPRTFSLPAGCDNQATLYIQIFKTNDAGASTTNFRIDEATLTGVSGCASPSEPTAQSTPSTANPSNNTLDVNWSGGNGSKTLIVASTSATWSGAMPTDATTYTADANFGGSGTSLGGGKVVYNGNRSTGTMTVTGLLPATTYYFYTFNFNVGTPSDCNPDYLSTGYTTTNGTTTTLSAPSSGLVMNEIYNNGNDEYVELLVVGTPGATLDIRGWICDDNNGDFNSGSATGVGVAQGHSRFKNICEWSAIPVGSLIIIYNEAASGAPIPIDLYDSNQDFVYCLPGNSSLLESFGSLPSTASNVYTPATYVSATWGTTSLKDECDCMQIRKPDYSLFQGISYSDNSTDCNRITQPNHPNFGTYAAEASFFAHNSAGSDNTLFQFMNVVDNNWLKKSNWQLTEDVTLYSQGTAGLPNGGNNTTWINSLRSASPIALVNQTHTCSWNANQTWTVNKPGVATDVLIAQLSEQNGTNRGTTTVQTIVNGGGTFTKTISGTDYVFLSKFVQVNPTVTTAGNYSVKLYYSDAEISVLVNYLNTTYSTSYTVATLKPKMKMYRIPANNLVAGTLVMNTSIFEITPTTGTYGLNHTFTGTFNAFSQYAIGVEDAPLPVEGMVLSAKTYDTSVVLSWYTLSERDNVGFDIERSINGFVFEKVGFVEGNIYSQTHRDYHFNDAKPLNGKSYYRLQQKDLNGKTSFSNMVEVVFNPLGAMFVYPNPAKQTFQIMAELDDEVLDVKMYNLEGKEVFVTQGDLKEVNADLKTKNFQAGVYQLSVRKGKQTETLRVWIQ